MKTVDSFTISLAAIFEREAKVGFYFLHKYATRQAEAGTQAVARQLRKQGVPLELALLILANRST